jgi:hypothetical protein
MELAGDFSYYDLKVLLALPTVYRNFEVNVQLLLSLNSRARTLSAQRRQNFARQIYV